MGFCEFAINSAFIVKISINLTRHRCLNKSLYQCLLGQNHLSHFYDIFIITLQQRFERNCLSTPLFIILNRVELCIFLKDFMIDCRQF